MQFRMVQIQALECKLCKQLHGRGMDDADAVTEAALFGMDPYALCPVCLQKVGKKTMADPAYRKGWRIRVKSLQAKAAKRNAERGRQERESQEAAALAMFRRLAAEAKARGL